MSEPIERLRECFREGAYANNRNRENRMQGRLMSNPYPIGTDEYKAWEDGYWQRDMQSKGVIS